MADLSAREKAVLAYTLLGEAGGEGAKGMEAVMHVIANRAASGRYPSNPAAVALQHNAKGIHQFSAWNSAKWGGNQPDKRYSPSGSSFQKALAIVNKVLDGKSKDPTGGATHYYKKSMKSAPYWFKSEAKAGAVKIGNHVFAARKQVGQAEKLTGPNDQPAFPQNPSGVGKGKQDRYHPVPTKPAVRMSAPVVDPVTGRTITPNNSFLIQEAARRTEAAVVKAGLNAQPVASPTLQPNRSPKLFSPMERVPGKAGYRTKNDGTIEATDVADPFGTIRTDKDQARLGAGSYPVIKASGHAVQALVPGAAHAVLASHGILAAADAAWNPKKTKTGGDQGGGFSFGSIGNFLTDTVAAAGEGLDKAGAVVKEKVGEAGTALQEGTKVLTNPLVQMVLNNQAFLASHPDEVGTMKTVYGTPSFFNHEFSGDSLAGGVGGAETYSAEYIAQRQFEGASAEEIAALKKQYGVA